MEVMSRSAPDRAAGRQLTSVEEEVAAGGAENFTGRNATIVAQKRLGVAEKDLE